MQSLRVLPFRAAVVQIDLLRPALRKYSLLSTASTLTSTVAHLCQLNVRSLIELSISVIMALTDSIALAANISLSKYFKPKQ